MKREERFSLFLHCVDSVLTKGISDIPKAVTQIETNFLTAMAAHDSLFGLLEEEEPLP
jgi:hypothetical protein